MHSTHTQRDRVTGAERENTIRSWKARDPLRESEGQRDRARASITTRVRASIRVRATE